MAENKRSIEHAVFLGVPRWAVALVFVVVELVVLLLAAVLALPAVPVAVLSVAWFAVCAVLFALLKGNASYVQDSESRREGAWLPAARARLDVVRADVPDELAGDCARLAEALRFSDPAGTSASRPLEEAFDAAFEAFAAAPSVEGARECCSILEKRNAACKADK